MMNRLVMLLLSVPNTLRFNLHYFPLHQAVRLPVLVSYKVRLSGMGKKGDFVCPKATGSVRLGFSDGAFAMGAKRRSTFCQEKGTRIVFEGQGGFCNPFYLTVNHGAQVRFGDNFRANTGMVLSSCRQMDFGSDVMLGWNVTVLDGDGHMICRTSDDKPVNLPKEISVGNHVWISANATILKGTVIADDNVVSAGAVVCGRFEGNHQVLGGVPAVVIKSDVQWKEDWVC